MTNDLYERFYALVREIPPGRVTTYGQLGAMCGLKDMRLVGDAMNASSGVPWQRVINSRGEISMRGSTGARQRALLEGEGVAFTNGRVDLAQFGWTPDPEWLRAHGYQVPPPLVQEPQSKRKRDDDQPKQPNLF